MLEGLKPPLISLPPRALARRLALGVILINLFVIALAASALYHSWQQYQERTEANTRNLAWLLEEEIGGDIEKIDAILANTSEEIAWRMDAGNIDAQALNQFLLHQQSALPEVVTLRTADAHGRVIYGNDITPGTPEVGERNFFTRQRDAADAGLVIDQPTPARLSKGWNIPMSRRINHRDGSFAGVVYVNLPIDHLLQTFATLELGRHGMADLRDDQLAIMVRYPEPDGMGSTIGKSTRSPELQRQIDAAPLAGTYQITAPLDHIERTQSYRKIGDYPLYITVGMASEDYLEGWWDNLEQLSLWELAFLIATLGGAVAFHRALVRQQLAYDHLHHSEERFRYTLENAPIGMAIVSLEHRLLQVNQALCQILGYGKAELKVLSIDDICHPEDLVAAHASAQRLLAGEAESDQRELRYLCKDGHEVWVQLTGSVVRDAKGAPLYFILQLENISERRQAAEQLALSAKVFEESGECIVITDKNERIVSVNRAFTEVTGYTPEEVLGKTPRVMSSGEQDAEFYRKMWQTLHAFGYWSGEIRDRRKNGEIFPKWVSISAVRNAQLEVTHYIGIFSDITERKKAEAQIEFLAYHDALTQLPNRLLARDHLEMAMAFAERSATKVAVLFLDLDNFKTINDSFGHATGDALLVQVAQRLRGCIRETDTISRQGGDEFLILLTNVDDAEDVTCVTEKILEQLEPTFEIEDKEISTSLSIGVALYPDDSREIDTLLQLADTAMYHAKGAGRNAYRFYTEQMNVDAAAHQRIRVGLRHALERNELELHYQPQIDLASGRVVGAEALIRWNHPELGLLPPGHFIATAEESGLIVPMGDWVLQEACRQAAEWRAAGLPELVVAVNISAMQLQRGNLEQSVQQALATSALPPACLELELTESILIQDTENALATVHRLKSIGLQLSIDDFGTGYSSLSYLKRFNVDKLKIDRSFVCDMLNNPNDAVIVRTIIQMARNLNLKTVAEGVEDEHLLSFLRLQYCDQAQGYHFSRPLPAAQFVQYLADNARATAGAPAAEACAI